VPIPEFFVLMVITSRKKYPGSRIPMGYFVDIFLPMENYPAKKGFCQKYFFVYT